MSQRIVLCVLDAVHGRPAAAVSVRIARTAAAGETVPLAGVTDEDGVWTVTLGRDSGIGPYHLVVDAGGYYSALGTRVAVTELAVAVLPQLDWGTQRVTVVLAPAGHSLYVGR